METHAEITKGKRVLMPSVADLGIRAKTSLVIVMVASWGGGVGDNLNKKRLRGYDIVQKK